MSSKTHKWVKFYNPRNSKIEIVACATCGLARDWYHDGLDCKQVKPSEHIMRNRGWSTRKAETDTVIRNPAISAYAAA